MTTAREALEKTGLGIMLALCGPNLEDYHHWVSPDAPGDPELAKVVWCQWCGQHRSEIPDWMDNPQCPAVVAVRSALAEGETHG